MEYFRLVRYNDNWKDWQKGSCKIAKRALSHLCYNHRWNCLSDSRFRAHGERYLKLLDFQYRSDEIIYKSDEFANVRHLQYPHSYLTKCFRDYEKKATSRPSAEVVN
uniref:Uncharacterized protein n=1 Tax=Panagrolaimus sp. PS1159 TaxID=55785 RepID=A0AC35F3M1_9BILA